MKRTFTLTFVLLLGAACGGKGNSGKRSIPDELMLQIPWTSGRPPIRDATGAPIVPTTPQYPPIASGVPDPGSRPANCSAQEGLEFLFVEKFEPRSAGSAGAALAWSSYDDLSDGSFRTPGEVNWYSGISTGAAWGLPAQELSGLPSCNGPSSWALHFKGGRFDRYGAGLSHPLGSLPDVNDCPSPDVCVAPPVSGKSWPSGIPSIREDGKSFAQPDLKTPWNLSSYDGISFWARRGPEGQGSISVLLHDQYTSDDLNRENNTFCTRVKTCRTTCVNGEPCSETPPDALGNVIWRCFDPNEGGYPAEGLALDGALEDALYPRCGVTACSSPSTFVDADFDGKECRPVTFQQHESAEYCFNADEEPADSGERCGDGYAAFVTLTTDWQFFKVPFSELRQQGFGKVSKNGLDLSSVSTLVFTFTHGWVDTYLDDIAFYKEAK